MKELESKNLLGEDTLAMKVSVEIQDLENFKNEIEVEMAELYTDLMRECPGHFSVEQAPVAPKKATA